MKSSWVKGLLILSVFFSLALKKDDVVELEGYFNARYSADFLKTTPNVKFVMPPGTQGKIQEVKLFEKTGNHGLLITLQNGKNKGEKVWVYYKDANGANPGMKLFEGDAAKSATTTDVEKAKSAETTESTTAWRTPAGEKIPLVVTKEYAEKLMKQVDNVNAKIKVAETKNNQPCDDNCKLAQQTYGRDLPKPEDEETKELAKAKPAPKRKPVMAAGVRDESAAPVAKPKTQPKLLVDDKELPTSRPSNFAPPSQDSPTLRNIPNTENRNRFSKYHCFEPTDDVSHCSQDGYGVTSIQVRSWVSRKIVPGELLKNRKWQSMAPAAARQDAALLVTDDLGGNNSSLGESTIMLFPRVTMPSLRSQGNNNVMTLPSGETVTFEKHTGRVVGGVFSEQPMVRGAAPRVTYKGNKLMIRANSTSGDSRLGGGSATVSKQTKDGYKSCEIPKKVLWSQSDHDGQAFKFFSDKDLDAYLKSNPKCKFGIYDE